MNSCTNPIRVHDAQLLKAGCVADANTKNHMPIADGSVRGAQRHHQAQEAMLLMSMFSRGFNSKHVFQLFKLLAPVCDHLNKYDLWFMTNCD